MALGGAVVDPAWVGLFRDVAKKMTTLTWLASRAFNHFLLSNVIGGQFSITKRSVLVQVLGLCFKIGGVGTPQTAFNTQPVVAAWIDDFRALNAAFPLVDKRGLTNVVQAARNQYATSVENDLTFGLRDLYVRALKALSVADAEVVALRVLSHSVAKRPEGCLLVRPHQRRPVHHQDTETRPETRGRDRPCRASRGRFPLMGTMQTYNDAFRFLHRIRCRLEQDDARRRLGNPDARPSRAFSLAPLTSMKPCFIRVDKKGLGELWSAHLRSAALVDAPRCIEDVLDVRARPHLTIGDSFQTDGTQLVVPYLTLTTKRQFLPLEARAKRVAAAANRDAKLAAYHDQKARLAAGDSIHWG